MTTAIPAAGTVFWISVLGAPTIELVPTAITKANPAVVTVDDTTGVTSGDVISFANTNFAALDGKSFVVGDVTATDLTILNADTTNETATLSSANPTATVIPMATGFDKFCLSTFSREAGAADTVSVGTFCDPSATIAGTSDAGTISFAGYMDPTEDGYLELMKAVDDKQPRTIMVELPNDLGYVVMTGTINAFSESYDLGQAISWTSGMSLKSNPNYIFTT